MTPQDLFDYANKSARLAESKGLGTVYPTVRQAARHFKVKQADIQEACDDFSGDSYLGLIVGFKNSSGWASIDHLGDCQIEAYSSH